MEGELSGNELEGGEEEEGRSTQLGSEVGSELATGTIEGGGDGGSDHLNDNFSDVSDGACDTDLDTEGWRRHQIHVPVMTTGPMCRGERGV